LLDINFRDDNLLGLKKDHANIEGNYRVRPNFSVRNEDAILLDFQLNPPFKNDENRKIIFRLTARESRMRLIKEFTFKASN
jgi:hypothetical protein